jgi:hypothetical protein
VINEILKLRLPYSFQHVVKAPRAGYIEGLKITPGQQVFDSSVLFTIKVCGILYNIQESCGLLLYFLSP